MSNKANKADAGGRQPSPNPYLKPMGYRPPKAIAAAFLEYRKRYELAPDRSKIITAALVEFFKGRGIDVTVEDED